MAPKKATQSEGDQKSDQVTKLLRRSRRLENNAAAAAAAATAKEDSKPQKRARKLSPKPKKQAKGKEKKIVKEDDASAQNGETKADEIHVSRPSVSVTSARAAPPHLLSVKGQFETVAVKGTEN
ncbi:high mobility group nucleosome-binding domain-containing protein 3 isoform X1 [Scyliorhinus torazame]|uniref:high mobility group nucleosome-binding domain-containing protein 3 isoform X1 n=1 Tax=Scyliorhinus torazame TaxID=75743 RepID=UPI003B5CB383